MSNCVSLKNHFTGEGMKFGQLILRRIVKIVAIKCQILRLTDRRQTSDRRQTTASLNASALWGWRHNKRLARNSAATVYKLLQISK